MSPYNGFILSIVLTLPLLPAPNRSELDCQEMRLKVEVQPPTEQGSNIQISVPRDADVKVVLMRLEPGTPPEEVQLVNGKISNVAPGQYELLVQDKSRKYCVAQQTITVN